MLLLQTLEYWFGWSPPPLILPLRVLRSSWSSVVVPSRAWSKTRSNQWSMSDVPAVKVVSSSAARRRPPPRELAPSSASDLPWSRRRVSVRNFAPAGMSGIYGDTRRYTSGGGYKYDSTSIWRHSTLIILRAFDYCSSVIRRRMTFVNPQSNGRRIEVE